jgi:hypothetical protein
LPSLPEGYSSQVVGRFHDAAGVVSYEFTRVYGRAKPAHGGTDALSELVEGESYWASSWPMVDANGVARPAGRWLSYSQARERLGERIAFDEFSSVSKMHVRLVTLLGPA